MGYNNLTPGYDEHGYPVEVRTGRQFLDAASPLTDPVSAELEATRDFSDLIALRTEQAIDTVLAASAGYLVATTAQGVVRAYTGADYSSTTHLTSYNQS